MALHHSPACPSQVPFLLLEVPQALKVFAASLVWRTVGLCTVASSGLEQGATKKQHDSKRAETNLFRLKEQ